MASDIPTIMVKTFNDKYWPVVLECIDKKMMTRKMPANFTIKDNKEVMDIFCKNGLEYDYKNMNIDDRNNSWITKRMNGKQIKFGAKDIITRGKKPESKDTQQPKAGDTDLGPVVAICMWDKSVETDANDKLKVIKYPSDDDMNPLFKAMLIIDIWRTAIIGYLRNENIITDDPDSVDPDEKIPGKYLGVLSMKYVSLIQRNIKQGDKRGALLPNPLLRFGIKFNPDGSPKSKIYDGEKKFKNPKSGKFEFEPLMVENKDDKGKKKEKVNKSNFYDAVPRGSKISFVINVSTDCISNMGISNIIKMDYMVVYPPPPQGSGLNELFGDEFAGLGNNSDSEDSFDGIGKMENNIKEVAKDIDGLDIGGE